jgi:hypothetical protein
MAAPPWSEIPTTETGKPFGFVTVKATSPDLPGSSGEAGVPAVATTRFNIVPEWDRPFPEPLLVKYAKADPALRVITRARITAETTGVRRHQVLLV